jgi:hypothetical protein
MLSMNPNKPSPRFGDFDVVAREGFIAQARRSFGENNTEAQIEDKNLFHRHGANPTDVEYLVPIHTQNNLAAIGGIINNPEISAKTLDIRA